MHTRCSFLLTLLITCLCLAAGIDNAYGQQASPTPSPINVAAAANGGQASASSTINANFPASATINGEKFGRGWGAGIGGWNDATEGGTPSPSFPYGPGFPDTLTIEFNGARQIYEIDIYTLQDNFTSPSDPANLTFTRYGIVDFDVHYQTPNNTWQLVMQSNGQTGAIRGNNQVLRRLILASAVSARAIRITVYKGKSSSPSNYSRIVEVEAWATPVTMSITAATSTSGNYNFAFPSNGGYSVSHNPPYFQAYASNNFHANRWSPTKDAIWNFYIRNRGANGLCGFNKDPRYWDPKCSTDAIGYFWKRVGCTGAPNEACQSNTLWNVSTGMSNVDRYASFDAGDPPVWPNVDGWGVTDFQSIIDFRKINEAIPSPPPTGMETQCNPYNPGNLSTGGANAKVVQVKYPTGATRWFMAFNSQTSAHTATGIIGSDNWRILWATSTDGANWTILPEILFRSKVESQQCGLGFLVTDMFVDDGHFYMLFTNVGSNFTYLVRSPIELQNPSHPKGFKQWSVAAYPVVNGQYTWKDIPIGEQLDFTAADYNAYPVLPSVLGGETNFTVKQASIARVFNSSTPYSPSRYVAVTIDRGEGADKPTIVQLWSTDNLSKPFIYESNVTGALAGVFGYEFGFNHYPNNAPESPKIVSSGLHFWFTKIEPPSINGSSSINAYLITRNAATISGF